MIKKLHFKVLLLMATLVFGVGNVWGDEYTYTFESKIYDANNQTKELAGVNWTLVNNGSYYGYDATKGQQVGSGSKPAKSMTLSTSGISGTITSVKVSTSGASSISATFGVTVGGTNFKNSGNNTVNITATNTEYEFTGSNSGEIVLTWSQTSSKAIYVKKITVTYTTGGGSTVYTPAITPSSGTYNNVQKVSMTCDTDGATIYYTTDGTTPSTSSAVYSAPFDMTTAGTVKAYAVKDGMTASSVASATYTYEVADPVFSVAAGTIIAPQDVTITTDTKGATIYYTTDGSTPDGTSTEYTGPIHVDATMTIKAIAVKDGFTNSAEKTAAYTFFAINAKNINSGYFEKVTDASTLEDGDCILIVNEDEGMAMSTTQNDNNRGIKAITLTDETTYAPEAGVQKLILKKVTENEDEYFYFYTGTGFLYAASSSKNYLRTQTTINDNAKASISITSGNATIEFQGSNTRNLIQFNSGSSIFSCYGSSQQPVQIYKEVAKNVPLTISDAGFATYCSAYALDFSGVAGLTAYQAGMNGTTVEFTEVSDVPAETGVLVKGAAKTYDVPVVASSSTDVSDNKLVGTVAGETIDGTDANTDFFVLKKNTAGVGFYRVTNAAYNVRANTAYLAVTKGSAKGFIPVDGTTAIDLVDTANEVAAPAYNLQGQRVSNGYKGVVIVNGKKIIK
jgi:ribosome-binding factor A